MAEITATYDNQPVKRAKGRILYDISAINTNKEILNNEGIYFNFKIDSTIFNTTYNMLLIGPEDTPYEGGFYFFEAIYPDQYPFYPMKMKSLTQGENVRKHPNLYVCGKCCFSFLGTWAGPPWTACQNPQTVAMSMRSVLTKNPINHEPGWEDKNDNSTRLYEKLITYFNLKYGVANIIDKLLENDNNTNYISNFKIDIINNFKKFFNKYLINLEKFKNDDGLLIESPIYSFSLNIDYRDLKLKLLNLKKKIDKDINK